MSKQQLKERGFTIIEVVLVLAIAALIFLMVFIALPALQRSQRDSARKNDVSIVSAAVNSFSSSNQGRLPAAGNNAALRAYVSGLSGNSEVNRITVANFTPTVNVEDGAIVVVLQAVCGEIGVNGGTQALNRGTLRQYATVTRLEQGNSTHCLSS